MAVPGITAAVLIYPGVVFNTNADSTPVGSPLSMRPMNISVEPEIREEGSTTVRGPGAGRGETSTPLTERAAVRMECQAPMEVYEGALPATPIRGTVIYLDYQNGGVIFRGAVLVLRTPLSNPSTGVLGINIEGQTQGNYIYSF